MDKVAVVIEQDTSGKKLYSLSQEEADRIEHRLQGGPDSDLESDVDDRTDETRVTRKEFPIVHAQALQRLK